MLYDKVIRPRQGRAYSNATDQSMLSHSKCQSSSVNFVQTITQDGDVGVGNLLPVSGLVTGLVQEVGNLFAYQISIRYLRGGSRRVRWVRNRIPPQTQKHLKLLQQEILCLPHDSAVTSRNSSIDQQRHSSSFRLFTHSVKAIPLKSVPFRSQTQTHQLGAKHGFI